MSVISFVDSLILSVCYNNLFNAFLLLFIIIAGEDTVVEGADPAAQ